MSRPVNNKQEAREWLDETLAMNGNAFLSASQARAVSDFSDSLADLLNVYDVHPVYLLGILSTMEQEVYRHASESVERALEMAEVNL